MNERKINRRDFIKGAAITGAGLALGGGLLYARRSLAALLAGDQGAIDQAIRDHKLGQISDTDAQATVAAYMTTPSSDKPRVVHIRDADATNWSGSGSFYNAVNQNVVNTMVQTGLQHLTGRSTWSAIWGTLFGRVHPGGYSAGQKIAIKVSFNNSSACDSHDNKIDTLPQPVLALISGMVAAGVQASDITIYDATKNGRIIPNYFRDPITAAYSNVNYVGRGQCSGVVAASHGKDPSLTVQFNDPDGYLNDRKLADVLYDATYLINMPIPKRHGGDHYIPVSLGFKNHLGSLNNIVGGGNDDIHKYMRTSTSLYEATYSPVVDIYSNPNIKDKTVLTLGDGLYGAFGTNFQAPTSWDIFGDAFNSLFFATDPVAIDCVMADFLVAEGRVSTANTYDYLFCAVEAGLGVCEGSRSDPGGDPLLGSSGYDDIEYLRFDL